ncbi:hypothetical protein AABB24_011613 [Solanum stoloniferum]|uniref:Cysteine proteinase inhibitor n=1 Tax=Solanum stoloniferum TaxID=62892 RepID=A0ABD2UHC7_9SOLN
MAIVGGLVDVPFENKVEFDDLARFAVQDYNQKNDSSLEFKKVLNVKQQIVAGIMYYITFEATEGGNKKEYEAKILLRKWEDLKKVVGFKLVGDDSTMPGGIVNVPNPNNTEFQELARFAIQDYNKKQNAHLEFVENLNVKEQVVAGIMYYITLAATDDAGKKKIYETKIWVKEWEDFKKVVEFKLVGDDSAKLGGITDVPFPNNPEFQDLARFAIQGYNKKENVHLEFVENLNVKQQVVAGMMYYITLAAIDAGKKKIYETKIWVKEWEDFKKVVEFKLVGDDSAKIGGIINVPNPNSPEFQDMARFAVQDYNNTQNAHLEFVENLNVKEQLVAGMIYYITLVATDAGKKKIYEAKIWVKEWEDFKKVVEFKLVGDDSAKPGGIIIVPFPNSPEFQDLARFAVQDFNKKENGHLEFVEVLNLKEQVVAGIMYYIILAATDAGKKEIYETKILVKEWENFKEVQEFKLVGDATK